MRIPLTEITTADMAPDSRDVHGWQPIATASKDGNEVDLWCLNISDGNGARFPAMFWDKDGGWQDWHSYLLETKWRPTHWMHPPAPPRLEEGRR